jgi:hypothetical protein
VLLVEKPVEVEPALWLAVGRSEESGVGCSLQGDVPALDAAANRQDGLQPEAAGRGQELAVGPAFAGSGGLPGRKGEVFRARVGRRALRRRRPGSIARGSQRGCCCFFFYP